MGPMFRTPWMSTITRHPERIRRQHQRAEHQCALAIADGVQAVGSPQDVAELLQFSERTVRHLHEQPCAAPTGEPLPDQVEVDLPNAGGRVWTSAEWEHLNEAEPRQQTAHATARFWRARAHVFEHQARDMDRAQEAIAEAILAEWESPQQLQVLVTQAGGGQWAPLLFTIDDVRAHVAVLSDLVAGYQDQARQAWRQEEIWRLRAEQEQD